MKLLEAEKLVIGKEGGAVNSFSHMDMAKAILRTIENELSVKLDRRSFIIGNIKPDFSRDMIRIAHYKETAANYVCRKIKKLLNYNVHTFPRCSRQFSERLGIVTHYLCDFFCYAHSVHFTGKNFEHCLYEWKLSRCCKRKLKYIQAYNEPYISVIGLDSGSIQSYIDEMYKKYMESSPAYQTDLEFSFKVCASVCLSIISVCLVNDMEAAA